MTTRRGRHGASQWQGGAMVMVLLWVTGCAVHAPPPAPPTTGYLYVVRTVADDLAEFIPIQIDTIDTGMFVPLTPQTYTMVSLAPGRHAVTSFLGDYTVTMPVDIAPDQATFVRLTPLGGPATGRVGFEQLTDAVGRAAVQQALRVHGSLRRGPVQSRRSS